MTLVADDTEPSGRALGLDIGSKTIGLALTDADGVIASAHGVIPRGGHVADAKAVTDLVVDRQVDHLVVGWPLELDGTQGRRARAVLRFLAVLEPQLMQRRPGIVIHRWDERFSTRAAERTLLEGDLSRAKRKQKIDAVAAQFILEGWLAARRNRATTT